MRFCDRANDEESEARAFHASRSATAHAVEAAEDTFQFVGGNADAAVANFQFDVFFVGRFEADGNIYVANGIFDGVIEKIRDRGAKFFGIALDCESGAIRLRASPAALWAPGS